MGDGTGLAFGGGPRWQSQAAAPGGFDFCGWAAMILAPGMLLVLFITICSLRFLHVLLRHFRFPISSNCAYPSRPFRDFTEQ